MDFLTDVRKKTQEPIATQGITLRAVIIGLLLVAVLCFVTPYTDLVMQASLIASDHLPIGVISLYFLLMVAVNPFLRLVARVTRIKPFSSGELITIYVMMLVVAGIPSFGLTEYLFPIITAPYYFATKENRWADTIYKYIPNWFGPTDKSTFGPHHAPTIKRFYEGLKPGEAVPWDQWIGPLIAWSIFVFALYLVIVCLATILRKQWVERERLSFPLVQLPLEMAREEGAPGGNPFFRNRLVWIGIGIPAAIHTLNALHYYFPTVPGLELKSINIAAGFVDRPWSALNPMLVYVYFSVIGFSYLLSQEVGLGLWLFYIVAKLQSVVASAVGYQDPGMYGYGAQAFIAHQEIGAFIMIVIYSVWLARRQLVEVVRRAFGRRSEESDADEPMSYPAAFWGLVIGTLILIAWCTYAGMSPIVALAMCVLFYVIMIALAKFVADAGLLFVQASFRPGDLITTAVGTGPLGPANITLLNILQFIFMYDLRTYLMPSVMDGYRLADGPRLKRRSMFKAIAIALVAGVIISYISTLLWIYKTGGIKMHPWFLIQGNPLAYSRSVSQIQNPMTTSWTNLTFVAVGAAVCWLLMFMRQRYVGWPVHPIGYAMGSTLPLMEMWFPIMVGWALKSLILRYGGRRAYVQFRPFFLGLVLGEFGISGIWVVIDWLAHMTGHAIFPN